MRARVLASAIAGAMVSIAGACTFEYPYYPPDEDPPAGDDRGPNQTPAPQPPPPPPPVAGTPPGASCRELHAADPSRGDGFYLIDTDGAGERPPFEVYCDMNLAGGGWTLVGRSVGHVDQTPKPWPSPSEYVLIGWSSGTGDVRADDMPYSLDAHGAELPFESILVGDYTSGRTWGGSVYQLDVPPDFFTACATAPCPSSPRPVLGGCGDGGAPRMMRYVGRVFANGFFYIGREGNTDEQQGLYGSGFRLGGDDCTIHGGLEGAQGMIFVR